MSQAHPPSSRFARVRDRSALPVKGGGATLSERHERIMSARLPTTVDPGFSNPGSPVPGSGSRADGITVVSLNDLLAMRACAGKPMPLAARTRTPLAGGHVSALRGRGMDYAESRVYQPGDDVRNVDWRRTARSGKWHTKLFQAERERSLLLLIDTHATMRFGTRARYKSVAAARAAAWLAWTCVREGDRVGALAFGATRAAVVPHPGSRGALAALGALAHWDVDARTAAGEADESLSAALMRTLRLVAPGSQVWLLSDGWCADDAAAAALARLARRAEVRVVIVADALECGWAPAGRYVFDTGREKRVVDLAGATPRAQFRERMSQGWRKLSGTSDAAGVAWTTLMTDAAPDAVLAPLRRQRKRRP